MNDAEHSLVYCFLNAVKGAPEKTERLRELALRDSHYSKDFRIALDFIAAAVVKKVPQGGSALSQDELRHLHRELESEMLEIQRKLALPKALGVSKCGEAEEFAVHAIRLSMRPNSRGF